MQIFHGRASLILAPLALLVGCAATRTAPEPPAYGQRGIPQRFEGMGPHTRRVTTTSAEAQAYFDQGLNWLYSFNHDESVRSFKRSAELDPRCAMAWWGISYAQGPNYNDPIMSGNRSAAAWEALQRALAAIDDETPEERALVDALTHRYASDAPQDRAPLDAAFASAMGEVRARFPNDSDVGTLYAESMMVRHPWKLYGPDRKPARDETRTIVAVLEQVLGADPNHPGANHLYIHAVEPSEKPDLGIGAADRLSGLVPGSGHMEHMPSHIYAQVGMWERSIEQNTKATARDREYRKISPEQGKQNRYMAHNAHMLAFSAMMIGREREATNAARAMWKDLSEPALREYGPSFEKALCSIYDIPKRFGRWDALLAEPAPPDFLPTVTAIWRAHRAVAFAAKKDFPSAAREHEAFRAAIKAVPEKRTWDTYENVMKFLAVSDVFIEGEIALQKDRWDDAASLLEKAAQLEDVLGYGEPPAYLQPVRHTLGALYLKRGRYADAERVYREDLAKWRRNGWSLYGLSRALEGLGRRDEASAVREDFERVWAGADEPTATSCKCILTT